MSPWCASQTDPDILRIALVMMLGRKNYHMLLCFALRIFREGQWSQSGTFRVAFDSAPSLPDEPLIPAPLHRSSYSRLTPLMLVASKWVHWSFTQERMPRHCRPTSPHSIHGEKPYCRRIGSPATVCNKERAFCYQLRLTITEVHIHSVIYS